jgi:hypothetical protein
LFRVNDDCGGHGSDLRVFGFRNLSDVSDKTLMVKRIFFFALVPVLLCFGCQSGKPPVMVDGTKGPEKGQQTATDHVPAAAEAAAEEQEKAEGVTGPQDEVRETESILDVIESLEESYKNRDYDMWKSFLTEGYRKKYGDPKVLKREGWDATDLHSFFDVLIEARARASIGTLSISRIEFINPNKALVYVMLGGEEFPEPQHTFIKINDRWYKGLFEEGE